MATDSCGGLQPVPGGGIDERMTAQLGLRRRIAVWTGEHRTEAGTARAS
jgi:hypothetical protein